MCRNSNLTYRQDYFKKTRGIGRKDIYVCAYCGKVCLGKKSVHLDHVYPKSHMMFKAQKNATSNLVTSCPTCNKRKSDKVSASYLLRGYFAKVIQNVMYSEYFPALIMGITALLVVLTVNGTFDADLVLAGSVSVLTGMAIGFNKKLTGMTTVLAFAITFFLR